MQRDHPTTLSRQVLDSVGQQIVSGGYPPGTILRIEDLQRAFNVSRTVVRDVLRHLDSLHLTTSRPRLGVRVNPVRKWNVFAPDVVHWRLTGDGAADQLRSLTELRTAVEPQAAELAAGHAPGHVGLRLVELGELMADAAALGDLDAFLAADLEFHSLVLHHSGNEMFAALDAPIAEALKARHRRSLVPDRPRDIAVLLHLLVATGIRDGEAPTARTAMRQLVAEAGTVVASLVDAGA